MKVIILIESAIKAILKNGRRSALTIIGIIVGIAAVIAIVSVGRGYEKYSLKKMIDSEDTENNTAVISFMPSESSFNDSNLSYYNEQDLENIATILGVSKVTFEEEKTDEIFREKKIVVGNEEERKKIQLIESDGKDVLKGTKLSSSDIGNKVVTISTKLVEQMFDGDKNKAIGNIIEIDSENFIVKGVFSSSISNSVFLEMNTETYNDYFDTSDKKNIEITVPTSYSLNDVSDKVLKLLDEKGSMKELGKYHDSSNAAAADAMSSILKTLTLIISLIGGISLFISGIGVMNMVYTSISERNKEIGIRRTLGATEQSIQIQFLLEGLLLTVFGGIIGYLIGLALAKAISWVMNFEFFFDPFVALLAIGISVIVGLVFSYVPSRNASKKDVVELVR